MLCNTSFFRVFMCVESISDIIFFDCMSIPRAKVQVKVTFDLCVDNHWMFQRNGNEKYYNIICIFDVIAKSLHAFVQFSS